MLGDAGFRGVNCTDAAGFPIDFPVAMEILRGSNSTTDKRYEKYTRMTYFNWRNAGGELIQTWLKDVESLEPIYEAAKKLGLGGVGVWTLTKLDYAAERGSAAFGDTREMWGALHDF
jgi:spore germination protein YaaH